MGRRLLQEGDIITLKAGMKVYAGIPEMFVYANRKFSNQLATTDVTIGTVLSRKEEDATSEVEGIKDKIKDLLFKTTVSDIDSKVENFISGLNLDCSEKKFDTSKYEGRYQVCATAYEGGGCASPNKGDTYPNGHHVFCQKIDDPSIVVNFYQTGAFTAMITDIEAEPQ